MKKNVENILLGVEGENEEGAEFFPLITDGGPSFVFNIGEDESIPVLPLRNVVLFPDVVLPVSLGRKRSLNAVRAAYKNHGYLGAFAQKDARVDAPEQDDIFPVGCIAQVIKILELPDGSTTAILQGKHRIKLTSYSSERLYYKGTVSSYPELMDDSVTRKDFNALIEALKDVAIRIIKGSSTIPNGLSFAIKNIEVPLQLINFISANFNLNVDDRQKLLEITNVYERAYTLLGLLNQELQLVEVKMAIQAKTQEGIDQQQKEYYLQQQMKAIQEEMGDSSSKDVEKLREKAKGKKWPESVKKIFEDELSKLERTQVTSHDYGVQLNYVETIVNLPWGEYTKDSHSIKKAKSVLDRDHYGMEKVKDRILEHLAVMKLKGDMKSPIICLYGPPGVGKTSLGKSIAESLNRKYVRISLGGLHDEAEIRGHRRTYIGAMPGRIIQSLQKAESSNPVFILDEIDKVCNDMKGDPESALLEVLDPEQNVAFHDNFLDIDYDLSHVMFIATANNLNTISQPLLDRMELIEVSGYITEEKIQIALRHLIPNELEKHGLTAEQVSIPADVLEQIISSYTRESGVRELEKQISKVMRKVAYKIAMKEEYEPVITKEALQEYLGVERYTHDEYQGNDFAGVVTGLAWTAVGGEILYVETSLSKSKAPKLTLTGSLGDVMKESAVLALEYIRAHADYWDIPNDIFEEYSIHVHVPEGAVPKDGPSAGVTMTTSIVSALTKRKIRKNLAMTGEITLRGKVLPVGGIREKILAAKRAGIKDIILCEENKKDIDEIKPEYLKGLSFYYVKTIKDVTDFALLKEKVD
ncbi:MAG: endopeptidase La [Paludibacteraceae bacterium]|nr:endopeptidase La [Paludibacteraceae bacterium]